MVIRISQLKLPANHNEKQLRKEIEKELKLFGKSFSYEIMRRSIDARKKPDIYYVYTVDVTTDQMQTVLKKSKSKKAQLAESKVYTFPVSNGRTAENSDRPVIVGSGPAGLFCALMLARAGQKPLILERGQCVEERQKTVEHFWKSGELNVNCNVQFGEGGAGTFSDGKLNTLVKDPDGKIRFVMKEFVKAGANPEIMYDHKPHIGTDVLIDVVRTIRQEILALGGEIRFESQLTAFEKKMDGSYQLYINGEKSSICTSALVLAIGHSARDTFEYLYEKGLNMQQKPFAVGLRMQHPQKWVDAAMYGEHCTYELGAAPYKLTHKCANERGVYSFCMCPGGYVVNASSEEGYTAVNGMSYSRRDSENANSAIVVTVSPEDYRGTHPLDGMYFQRELEKKAWTCAQGKIPVQRFEDYEKNQASIKEGSISVLVKGQYQMSNLRGILPEELNDSIIEGVHAFTRQIKGFDHPDALLLGVESRTSSPVRIVRDDLCQSNLKGVFPCGEGAGYAGGITSAAVDGIRVAEAVLRNA